MESMSASEDGAKVSALVTELHDGIERATRAGEIAGVPAASITALVSEAVKLYAAAIEDAEPGADSVPVIDATVSTTEAMVVACALLRAHHLNPFDLALWFSRTAAPRGQDA